LHNPLPHLAFALPWLVWHTFFGENRLKHAGWLLTGYLPFSLLLGMGWVLVMRDINFVAQTQVIAEASALIPVQPKPFWVTLAGYFKFFTWPDSHIMTVRLGGLFKLWLWAVPLLLTLAIVGIKRSQSTPLRLLAASALTMFFAYFLIPFSQGHGWGYRYFHPAWFTLPILAVVALRDRDINMALSARLAVCALASLLLITPIRAWQMGDFVSGHVAQIPVPSEPRAANECEIVFHNLGGFYGIDMVENKPELQDCRLTFISRGFADDLKFAQRVAPGGQQVVRDSYGWVYRYPVNKVM